jgi:hypothetical protein
VITAARLQSRAAAQNHDEFAVRTGLELVDVSHVDDIGAMDAQEHLRIQ